MDIRKNFIRWYTEFTCGHCYSKDRYSVDSADAELFAVENDYGEYVVAGMGFAILKCEVCNELNIVVLDVKDAEEQYPDLIYENEIDPDVSVDDHPELLSFSDAMWGVCP